MITWKKKLLAVGICTVLLLLFAGFHLFYEGGKEYEAVSTVKDMEGKALGGVVAKMPDASAKIFFESLMGVKLQKYRSYKTQDSALTALYNHEIQAIWAADVTGEYLAKTNSNLSVLTFQNTDETRLSFGFALREDETALRDKLNAALAMLQENGTLDALIAVNIQADDFSDLLTVDEMRTQTKEFKKSAQSTLYVGVTGSVPPIDLLNEDGEPYGFSVALMDEIGITLGRKIRFIVLDNETVFTELMSGRIDMVFCYGTSKNHSTTEPDYLMTDGYYPMTEYVMVVSEE